MLDHLVENSAAPTIPVDHQKFGKAFSTIWYHFDLMDEIFRVWICAMVTIDWHVPDD